QKLFVCLAGYRTSQEPLSEEIRSRSSTWEEKRNKKHFYHAEHLRGKVIWITGASSGLGEHLAYELAHHGSKLIISGTSEERLNKVKTKCLEIGLPEDDVFVLPFNMTDFDVHEECVKKVQQKFHKLDVLVNNAGRSQRASFAEIDVKVDKELFEINVFATLNLTRKVLHHFLENHRGHFVVTSSCVGKMGY
ncbi:unnamed protein product, partial [Larinioides sclopetarius]